MNGVGFKTLTSFLPEYTGRQGAAVLLSWTSMHVTHVEEMLSTGLLSIHSVDTIGKAQPRLHVQLLSLLITLHSGISSSFIAGTMKKRGLV